MKRREFIKSAGLLGTVIAVAPQILLEPVMRIAPIPVMPIGRELWEAKRLANIAFYEGTMWIGDFDN